MGTMRRQGFTRPVTPLSFYILAILAKQGEQNAYLLGERARHESGGFVCPSTGTMHNALKVLAEENWIERIEGGAKVKYRLSDHGRRMLKVEVDRLSRDLIFGRMALEFEEKRSAEVAALAF